MSVRLKAAARALARRFAMTPSLLVHPEIRAEIIEELSNAMIVETRTGDRALRFYAPTRILRNRATGLLDKEPDMIRWINEFTTEAVFWDIGANVGMFSLYAAARSGCRVLAFEPAAANFHVLARNIDLNKLTDRVMAYCVAFSGDTGLGVLNLASLEMGAALGQFGAKGEASPYAEGSPVGGHGMLGFTIDRFVDLFSPPLPTHIKIDVDGLELAIVNGGKRTFGASRLQSVMLELSLTDNNQREQGMALMSELGFRCASRGDIQRTSMGSAANHLFTR